MLISDKRNEIIFERENEWYRAITKDERTIVARK